MIKGGIGGANTLTGIEFEGERCLIKFFESQPGYTTQKNKAKITGLFYKGSHVAYIMKKHGIYRFLEPQGIRWQDHLSKQLLPDSTVYVLSSNTMYIVEFKYQQRDGSVDEKLQTCDFKKKQYTKLFSQVNIDVEYMYILNDWFKHPKYKDTLDYVTSMNCYYYFNYIPLKKLGLPVPS